MKSCIYLSVACGFAAAFLSGCIGNTRNTYVEPKAGPKSYAIYSEYSADSNKLMKNGLNRRIFNKTEVEYGSDIRLNSDGSITLQPGTYRITGFSAVTMQTAFAPPVAKNNNAYPGYCLVYTKETESNPLATAISIGSPGTAYDTSPSLFDAVYTCEKETHICVGHQVGEELNNEVYISVYFDGAGKGSPYHLFARISIFEL